MIRYILFFLLFNPGAFINLHGQCLDKDPDYRDGEYIKYEVAYNWGLIWVDAGEVYFKTDTIFKENKKYYHFESYGQSYPFYDWFYKVRDRYESCVCANNFLPQYFHRSTSEGGYKVDNTYSYSPDGKNVLMKLQNSRKEMREDTLNLDKCALDVLSAIYFTRNLDFKTLNKDSTYPLNFIIDGELFNIKIRFLGREIIKNRDDKRYACIRFSAQLVAGTIFKEDEELYVWVSDDENKIPILVEARVLVGSVKAYLTKFRNLKTPLIWLPQN